MANMAWTGLIAGTIAVAAAAAAFGYSSFVDGTPARSGARSTTSSDLRLMRYDVDRDGRVSRPEYDGALTQEFRNVDMNGDGRLDAAELQRHAERRRIDRNAKLESWRAKARADGRDPRKPPSDLVERDNIDSLRYGDWNLDGAITPDEFGGRARAQFMRSDRNGDGMITAEELRRRPDNRRANSA